MQVSAAYVLMDLVWILLKTKGVDPTNHPVMQELERVKSYFGKIKRVQENEKEEPGKGGNKVDRSAAGGLSGRRWRVSRDRRRGSILSSMRRKVRRSR